MSWNDPDSTFKLAPTDTVQALVAAYRHQCDLSRQFAAHHQLPDTVPHPDLGEVSLRWIYIHLIDETARHTGQADILREQTDTQTGS